jgi:hypothetical protein
VVFVAALLIAARLFFPVHSFRGGTDLATTLLHVLGILVLAAAVYFVRLAPRTYLVLVAAALVSLRVMVPVQGAPAWSESGPFLEPSLSDRFWLTVGVWHREGWTAPTDWAITTLHAIIIIIAAGVLIFLRVE